MYGGYFKGFKGASALRQLILVPSTLNEVLEVLLNFTEADLTAARSLPNVRAVAVKASLPTSTRSAVQS